MLNEQLKFQTTEWTRFSTFSFFFAFNFSKNIGHRPLPGPPRHFSISVSHFFSFSLHSVLFYQFFGCPWRVRLHDCLSERTLGVELIFFDSDSSRSTSGWCVWSVDVGRHSWSISRLRGCFRRPLIQSAAADRDVLHYAVAFGDKSSN